MKSKVSENKRYVRVSDVKKKIRYIAKQYGMGSTTMDAINKMIDKLPFVLESELENTLTSEISGREIKEAIVLELDK